MTVDYLEGCLFSKPMMMSFVNDPLLCDSIRREEEREIPYSAAAEFVCYAESGLLDRKKSMAEDPDCCATLQIPGNKDWRR